MQVHPQPSDHGSLRPINDERFGYEQARHLLWRAGFGGTPQQIQTLVGWGPAKAVDHLLGYGHVEYEPVRRYDFDPDIMRAPTDEERRAYRAAQNAGDEDTLARLRQLRQQAQLADRRQIREIQRWWLTRMIETPRPLEEKMTLFWHGHFATSYRTIENSYHMFLQNQLFRANAVGSFADLLHGIIRDPAMLAYLDNDDSRRGRPNENLARELMELFSLGVGNYTEQDIREGARALTGYTFDDDRFVLDSRSHDDGPKSILGAGGRLDGDGFVTAILRHPACARFITRRLYRFFVAELPDGERDADEAGRRVLAELAGVLRATDYRVAPMLRRLFLSEHFYDEAFISQQIKSPVQLVVGAIRSMLLPTRDLDTLLDAMALMGQNILFPPSVKGWDGGRAWISTSTLFVRQNTLAYLLTGLLPDQHARRVDQFDARSLIQPLAVTDPEAARDPSAVAEFLLRFAIGSAPSDAARVLSDFAVRHGGAATPDVLLGMLLLITALPEYQLC